jgi:hypothetical protein
VSRAVICFGGRLLDYSLSPALAPALASLIEMCEKVSLSLSHDGEKEDKKETFSLLRENDYYPEG